jgi:hypothetical protein
MERRQSPKAVRRGAGEALRPWACRASALAISLTMAACGSGLPGLGDELEVEVHSVSGYGYYSHVGDMYDLSFDALVGRVRGDGDAHLKSWSFSLVRRGQTIATIDAGTVGQYGLAITELDKDIDWDGTARVMLGISGMASGRAFYGTDPPDTVVFRCKVDRDHGGDVDLQREDVFVHSEM